MENKISELNQRLLKDIMNIMIPKNDEIPAAGDMGLYKQIEKHFLSSNNHKKSIISILESINLHPNVRNSGNFFSIDLTEKIEIIRWHEKNMIDKVLESREHYLGANSVGEKAVADNEMSGALKSLFALAENYPDLRSNENFIQFQSRISSLEDDIADRREFYKDSVNNYNIRNESMPDVFIANSMGLKEEEMFEVPESKKQDVEIDFSDITGD